MRLLHACLLLLIALALWVGCGGSGSGGVIGEADSGADVVSPPADATAGVDSSTPTIADAPLGVTAVAGDGQVSVTWIAPPNGGSPITGYVVTAAPGGVTALADAAATSATLTGLTNGSTYTFTVVAQNANGNSKPSSPSNPVMPVGAPDAPTDVVASRGNAQAGVAWKAPATNGGSAITTYVVTSAPGGFTATVTAPATIANVTGLSNGTSYTFTVVAKNIKGTSPPSAASNAVTPVVPTAPGAPTGATAVRGNAAASVSWTAPALDGGSNLLSYTVTANPGGATATVAAPATMATVNGLTNGTPYTFSVVATNIVGAGAASADSNSVTPAAVPGVPTLVSAVAAPGQATVSWSPPATDGGFAITSYTITQSPGAVTTVVNAPASDLVVMGLTNGTSYTFTVKATNSIGTGLASAASNAVTPGTVPDAPTAVKATIGNAQAQISWTAAGNGGSALTGYTVTSSPGGVTTNVGGAATTATVAALANGTAYTFTVVAKNIVGSSVPSSASNSVTPTACTLAGCTSKTAVTINGCAVRDRDTSGCQAARTAIGLSGFWLRFSCRVTLTKTTYNGTPVIQLQSDGQPDYPSFYFPNADACYEAYPAGNKNPSFIVARTFRTSVPVTPVVVAAGVMTMGGSIGMAINGVGLYNNRAAPGDDIFAEAATFDTCNAHPNNLGYHYHSEPYGISYDDDHFIGVMRDGFPVYGRRDPDGSMPVLDATGGHTGFTIDSPAAAVYHYHVNEQTSVNPGTVGEKQWFLSTGRLHGSFSNDCTGC